MIAIRRFVFWLAALLCTALSATAQLTWIQHGVVPVREPFMFVSSSDRPAAVFDETRNRILVPIYLPPNAALPGSRILWEFDGKNFFGPTVQDLPLEACAVADDARPGRKVMFSASGTRIWDPVTRHWDAVTPATSPPLDSLAAMALLPGIGTVLLHPNGQTWVWNGVTWNLIVTAHSPPPRGQAAMTRDVVGNRLLLVGGAAGLAPLLDAWLFDGTDWTQTSSPTYPFSVSVSRHGIATDEVRHQVVLFGGHSVFGYLGSTWLWDGAAWTQANPAHVPPLGEVRGMTWNPSLQKAVVFVDPSGFGGQLSTWAWDGTDWTQLLPNGRGGAVVVPQARSSPVLAYSNQTNKSVLFGGYTFLTNRNDTWESTGRVWQQRTSPTYPPATSIQAAAILRSTGDLYYFPGRTQLSTYNEQWNWSGQQWSGLTLSAPPITPLSWQVVGSLQSSLYGWVFVRLVTSGASPIHTLQLIQPFSGATATVSVPGGPSPRTGSVMVQSHSPSLASNTVWLFGGEDASGVDQNDVWELADTGSGGNLAWTQLVPAGGPLPPARILAAAAYDGGGLIYIMGGAGPGGNLGDTWTFNIVSRQWTQLTGPGPSARNGAAMTRDASIGRMVLFGGFDGVNVLNDIWECDGSTWTQRATPATPAPRNNASLVYDRTNHRSLLFGGNTGPYLNDTWSYDGSVWTPLLGTGPQPAPRQAHTACFDEFWNTMVVCGGFVSGNALAADTWRLSASQIWSQGPPGPSARTNSAMTYAILQGIPCSILVGGYTNVGRVGDTWRYDIGTNTWQQLATSLPPRDIHAIAWDRLRNVLVLFGGSDGGSFLDDTWELNLATATWTQRTPAHHPPGRWNATMQYDAGRARTVLIGGYSPSGYLNDVWDWDGTDWLQRTPETAPPVPCEDAAMAYDSDRGKLLRFGGWNGANLLGDLTELGARIDVAGPGNTAHPEGLRFYSQPAVGQPLQLGFTNSVLGLYAVDFGPRQQPLGPLPVPLACEPANLWASLVLYVVFGTTEPNVAWNVPNTPLILGMTLVFQGFSAQPANCWRATDALQVRF